MSKLTVTRMKEILRSGELAPPSPFLTDPAGIKRQLLVLRTCLEIISKDEYQNLRKIITEDEFFLELANDVKKCLKYLTLPDGAI